MIVRGRAERSRQCTVLPLTRVKYTGLSSVQITPWSLNERYSPRQRIITLKVENIPLRKAIFDMVEC